MKLRIQDNSIRLRMTLKELDAFADTGLVARSTQVVGLHGLGPQFHYRLEFDASLRESEVVIDGPSIAVRLCPADRATLLRPEEEGVYIRREWKAANGDTYRFMALVEKDRPASTCIKKEQWIYDAPPHGPVETRPIPPKSGGAGSS